VTIGIVMISLMCAAGVMLPVALLGTHGCQPYERSDAYFDVAQSQLIQAHMTGVEVEVDIFSGTANPH
jgi:hypothetical protein